MQRELQIKTPDGASQSYRLDKPEVVLGRSGLCELCYADDAGLSRRHLRIRKDGRDWILEDLESKNGTLLNGIRVSGPTRLGVGDRISAGHLVMYFADPHVDAGHTVVFVDENAEPTTSSTLVAKLDGLVSGHTLVAGAATQFELAGARQVEALIRAGRELAGHSPLNDLFNLIMSLSVDAVGASRGVLMVLEEGKLIVKANKGEGFKISRALKDSVLNTRSSLLIRDAQADQLFKDRMSIVEQQVRSVMAVPLQTNDSVIGLIYVDSYNLVRDFTKSDLGLLTVMANVAAIRIEHARLAERERQEELLAQELRQAAEIQRGLLPSNSHGIEGVEIAGYNAACHTVGGDYYDFFPYPGDRICFLVGDVAGKGMPAAMMMSSLQARVRMLAEDGLDAATLVARLNRAVALNCPANRFITFFLGILDPATGAITYCNAGHNPPLMIRRNGRVEPLKGGGLVLGILPKAKYQQMHATLNPGDVLVLYSDGVTEAARPADNEEFGEEQLANVIATAPPEMRPTDLVGHVNQAVEHWLEGTPAADDVTLVVIRRPTPETSPA